MWQQLYKLQDGFVFGICWGFFACKTKIKHFLSFSILLNEISIHLYLVSQRYSQYSVEDCSLLPSLPSQCLGYCQILLILNGFTSDSQLKLRDMSRSRRTNIFRRRRKWIRFKSHILSKRFPSQRTSTLVRMAPLRSHYIKCDRFAPRRARLQYYHTKETAQISIHNLRHSLK